MCLSDIVISCICYRLLLAASSMSPGLLHRMLFVLTLLNRSHLDQAIGDFNR